MRKALRYGVVFITTTLYSLACFAQPITITGKVTNASTKEAVSAISVVIKGGQEGVFTDQRGDFKLTVKSLPVTLVFTSVGFQEQELVVSDAASAVIVSLSPGTVLGQEVVVAASRLPQSLLESPVSIERVSSTTIRNAPAANYYDLVTNLKGVDVVTSSLTYRTPTTRGFAASGNPRFTQIVDGMDNQAPGLNFSVGAIVGLTELDVEKMELLPGASSALYGPGGMNGTLLITSKNPFQYTGLSYQIKTGIMHVGDRTRTVSPYYDWSVRWAQKVSNRFAFKIGAELTQAKDWVANDYRNYKRLGTTGTIGAGTRETDPNYDGVSVYGDETSVNLKDVLNGLGTQVPYLAGYISTLPQTIMVSRTGYTENEVVDPNTVNFKVSGALHYKITQSIEAIFAANMGTGNTVYTGSERYSLKDMKMAQYKLELNSSKWFIRTYTTQENAGQSHNLTVTSQLFNEAWKPTISFNNGVPSPQTSDWIVQYAFAYLNAKQSGRPDLEAHNFARSIADQGRPAAGSTEFKQIFDKVRKIPIPQGGLFVDKTDLWMTEGQYNLSSAVNNVAEVLVGGNFKKYVLNSEGTLFADKKGDPIKINEYGAYAQIGRDVIKDVLKLTASGRYDKNENFEGRFTPRITAVIKPAKDHNIRLSFQTAYRFPSTQQQWIDLGVGAGRLIGSNDFLLNKYNLINNPGYDPQTLSTPSPQKVPYKKVKPETVNSYEIGYRTAVIDKRLYIDVYGYYGAYRDFITRRDVVQFANGTPGTISSGRGFSIVVNSPQKVKTYGWGAGAEYLIKNNLVVSANASSDKLKDVPDGFRAFFNAPELRTVLSLANTGFGKNNVLGYNIIWRWQQGFFYENDFAQGDLPAYNTVDASFNVKLPKIKSMLKIGATNILNEYYRTAIGNPGIGGLYYVSFAYGVL
jgi:outer membrane receptor protein involved in Fe transport